MSPQPERSPFDANQAMHVAMINAGINYTHTGKIARNVVYNLETMGWRLRFVGEENKENKFDMEILLDRMIDKGYIDIDDSDESTSGFIFRREPDEEEDDDLRAFWTFMISILGLDREERQT